VNIRGFEHVYLETHNWGKCVAFWKSLGFSLDFETDHHSGQLTAPNGTRVFIAERSPLDPVGLDIFLGTEFGNHQPPDNVHVVHDWTPTHWGTQVLTVRDPDGRMFRLEAPAKP
jgi:catechol 2,3-dioxygenase-like lactoylglutathione lyase family enzyme